MDKEQNQAGMLNFPRRSEASDVSGSPKNTSTRTQAKAKPAPKNVPAWRRVLLGVMGVGLGLGLVGLCVGVLAVALASRNLPDVSALSDYRPILPLRIYSAEGLLIGEYGEERRRMVPIGQIPQVMKDAVLAIEDADFYKHGGVDYTGVVRAGLANLGKAKSQGASTITMQVARNVYLSSEKTITRKLYEILLTLKLEQNLSKDQILEIYMNQIYLGQRAYGFASAAEAYFGIPLSNVSIAQAAMLAGLPKAPSSYNPVVNPKRARIRQLHIIDRMVETGAITPEQAQAAKAEVLVIKPKGTGYAVEADFAAEFVRQLVFERYGRETYTKGFNVYTTIRAAHQNAAYAALRQGILDYDRRQAYRGPEKFIDLPSDKAQFDEAIDQVLVDYPNNGDMMTAVVLKASSNGIQAIMQDAQVVNVAGDGLRLVRAALSEKAAPNIRIKPGAVIRLIKQERGGKAHWVVVQLPEVEGAFVALDAKTGGVTAMVGGFDYNKNKFNHVTQAWRQPGSSFKPFVYSAAIEKGLTPATVINDSPLFFGSDITGGRPWEPKNYDGKFDGPMTMRQALARSKNMTSIRILQHTGTQFAQDYVTRFGFEPAKHPPYLTMALGAGSVTPMQMAAAYAVFANGGYRVNPYLIDKITDQKGALVMQSSLQVQDESVRVIDGRNAFIVTSLLGTVTSSGTAAKAQAQLKRNDVYGKTGTTNDAIDAWFAGYHPSLVGVTWIGYDTPRNLGSRETGGGLSLPVWIDFMKVALDGVPVTPVEPPEGLSKANGDWMYQEQVGNAVRSLGMSDYVAPSADPSNETISPPTPEERNSIIDLFR